MVDKRHPLSYTDSHFFMGALLVSAAMVKRQNASLLTKSSLSSGKVICYYSNHQTGVLENAKRKDMDLELLK